MVVFKQKTAKGEFGTGHRTVQAASLIVESKVYVAQVILAESYPGGLDGGFHLSLI